MRIVWMAFFIAAASPALALDLAAIDPSIPQDIRYATANNFTGRRVPGYDNAQCRLVPRAAAALARVQADLRAQNLSLKVYDCYRPPQATRFFVEWARSGGPPLGRFHPRIPKEQLFVRGYISASSKHSSGVAVDLTLVPLPRPPVSAFDLSARYGDCASPSRAPDDSLDMGTGYDCLDPKSATRSPAVTPAQRASRDLLVKAMAHRGFANYHREWWHFSYVGR